MALPFSLDNLASYRYNDGSSDRVTESYTYNSDHQLVSKAVTSNGTTQTYTYSYKDDTAKSLDSITLGSFKFTPKTDCLSRNRGKTIFASNSKIAEEQITYLKFGDHATNIPATIYYGDKKNGSYAFSDHFKYKYDSMGNIAEVRENGELYAKYAYDTIGRLVREDNKKLGKTVIFTYDTNGNILCRKEYAFTLTDKLDELECTTFAYTYDGDKMLSYNGEACVYDTIGNPTTYCNKTLTWENGRQLSSYDNTTFTYDNLGRRTKKNTLAFTYDASGNLIHQSNGISFIYDASGVCGLTHSGATYFYRKDILGNIIALLDTDGEIVATYTYDAWGKHTITDANGNVITNENHIANLNPFRYRGYYYDVETGLYFLKTRYYDPETGRFITIDDISYLDPDSINGLNLYAYCGNNPVMAYDPNGTFVLTTLLICLAAGAVAGGVLGGYTAYSNGQDILTGVFTGVLLGAAAGSIIGIGGVALSGALSSLASKAITDLFSVAFYGGNFGTWEDYAIAFAFGGLSGSLGNIISNGGRIASTIAQGGKFVSDILLRPAANQVVKMGTRGTTFNQQKLFYDAVTRSITYPGTTQIVKGNVLGYGIKIDFGKSFYRATTRYMYTYFMR